MPSRRYPTETGRQRPVIGVSASEQSACGELFCPFVRVDDLSRCVFRRRNYDLSGHVLELSNLVSLYVLILHLENARVRPFTFCAEPHLSHYCPERVCADVIPELGIIEHLRLLHCLLQNLKLSV